MTCLFFDSNTNRLATRLLHSWLNELTGSSNITADFLASAFISARKLAIAIHRCSPSLATPRVAIDTLFSSANDNLNCCSPERFRVSTLTLKRSKPKLCNSSLNAETNGSTTPERYIWEDKVEIEIVPHCDFNFSSFSMTLSRLMLEIILGRFSDTYFISSSRANSISSLFIKSKRSSSELTLSILSLIPPTISLSWFTHSILISACVYFDISDDIFSFLSARAENIILMSSPSSGCLLLRNSIAAI